MIKRTLVCGVVSCGILTFGCGGQEEEGVAPPEQLQTDAPGQTEAPAAQPATPEGRAQALMDQLAEQTMQKNWTGAEQTLRQLESLRPSVPQEMQEQIDNARGSYQAAKQIHEQGI